MELSTLGPVIKPTYEAEPFTKVPGPGQGNGNVISKTLKPTGGDFATFADFMEYYSGNVFNNVELKLQVFPGNYVLAPAEGAGRWNLTPGTGVVSLGLVGLDKATCIFECDSGGGYTGLFNLLNTVVGASGITFNGVGGMTLLFDANSSAVEVSDCVFNSFYIVMYGMHSFGNFSACALNLVDAFGLLLQGERGTNFRLYDCALTDWANYSYGIALSSGSYARLGGATSLANFWLALAAEAGSKIVMIDPVTFTGNTSATPYPLNTVQFDGSLITDGLAPLTFSQVPAAPILLDPGGQFLRHLERDLRYAS